MINSDTVYNILIFDDIFNEIDLMQTPYNFFQVSSEDQFFKILSDQNISLIIFDLELSGSVVIPCLKKLQDTNHLENSQLLILSTIQDIAILKNVLKNYQSDFLKKPFIKEEIFLKIELSIKHLLDKKLIEKQQKEIEYTLKKSKALIDSSINAMYIFHDNICIECNKEGYSFLDLSGKEETIDKHIFDIFPNVSKEHKILLEDNKVDHNFQTIVTTAKNKEYQVQIKERNIQFDTDNLKIISAIDITQIQKNEKALAEKTKLAAMGEMIGNIAHQWRQPLAAISIAASGIKLMKECEIEDPLETIESLDNIVKNTKFLSATIENFQNFLKDDRKTTLCSVIDLVQNSLNIVISNIKTANIEVITTFCEDTQVEIIQNDMIQVLLNIINNSVDILKKIEKSEERLLFIEVKKDTQKVYISIKDTAGGIDVGIIDKIFDPYFTTKHQSQGTGLGLYMTHQIVSKLGGTIEATNESFEYKDHHYYGAKFMISLSIIKD